jgi:aspartyl-tRNA(Asn)/glutamyl-tRNA(Gln) amidotransferase subunit C
MCEFMKLTREQVEHIATLARLRLTEAEVDKYSEQLSGILEYAGQLSAVDTAGVEPTSQVTGLTNIMREDEVIESGISEELVASAPTHQDGYVVIPKIFENK